MNAREAIRQELYQRFPSYAPKPRPQPADSSVVVLGRAPNKELVAFSRTLRNEHGLFLGTTGSGKSRALIHYARQVIDRGEALVCLEPHGGLSDALIHYCDYRERTPHIIDFTAPYALGFNPLWCPPGTDPSVIAGNVLDAVSVSRDDEPMHTKPTTERVLMTIFYTAAALNLTLLEVPHLLDHKDELGLRRHAITTVKDWHTREDLKRLHELSLDPRRRRDFDQEIVGPLNRLARLIRPQALRVILGQAKNTLDFGALMDKGGILIAKLAAGPAVYERDADLLGRLLLRSVLFHAKRRQNTRACNVIVDEAPRYFSADVPVLLAEVRKFGIGVLASMQWLEQAETYDENILAALLNATAFKVIFRLADTKQAEEVAHSVVPLDLEMPVQALIKPVVVGHKRTHFTNESDSTQEASTNTKGRTEGRSEGESDTEGQSTTQTSSTFESSAMQQSQSSNRSTNKQASTGTSETESEAASAAKSTGTVQGQIAGTGESQGQVIFLKEEGVLIDPEPYVSKRETRGASANSAETSSNVASQNSNQTKGRGTGKFTSTGTGESQGTSETHGTVQGTGSMHGLTSGQNTAKTRSTAHTWAENQATAETRGTGSSRGFSEGLEPILERLPTAVHGKQNVLYMAAQTLLNMKKGVCFVNFMGRQGVVATQCFVPPIYLPRISQTAFDELRNLLAARTAIHVGDAINEIEERQRELAKVVRSHPEQPESTPKPPPSNGRWSKRAKI